MLFVDDFSLLTTPAYATGQNALHSSCSYTGICAPAEVANGRLNLPARFIPPLSLWLEELGPTFGMPLKGEDVFQCYRLEDEHVTAIVDKSNSAKVAKTLANAKTRIAELAWVINFERLEMVCPYDNAVAAQKLKLWKAVACSGCRLEDMLCFMNEMQEAWNDATWESSHNVWSRNIACCFLEVFVKAVKEAADTHTQSSSNAFRRIVDGMRALFTDQKQEKRSEKKPERQSGKQPDYNFTGFPSEREDTEVPTIEEQDAAPTLPIWDRLSVGEQRKRFTDSGKAYLQAIQGVTSTERDKPALDEVAEMQAEVRRVFSGIEKNLANLQLQRQSELAKRDTLELEKELSQLRIERDRLKADLAAAVEQVRFVGERVTWEAERDSLEAERNRLKTEKDELHVRCVCSVIEKKLIDLEVQQQTKLWVDDEKPELEKKLSQLRIEKERLQANVSDEQFRFDVERVRFEVERNGFVAERIRLKTERDELEARRLAAEAAEAAVQEQLKNEKFRAAVEKRKFSNEKNRLRAEHRRNIEAVKQQKQLELQSAIAVTREEEQACRICFRKPHDTILLPCSHAHYCAECVEMSRRTKSTCPTCRAEVTGMMRYKL